MAKFTAYVQTWKVGSRMDEQFEIPDEELEGLTAAERDNLIDDYAQDAICNSYEWGWTEDES